MALTDLADVGMNWITGLWSLDCHRHRVRVTVTSVLKGQWVRVTTDADVNEVIAS